MKQISLSIIIPVFNAEAWIEPTVSHIITALKESDFKAEIIIVDDGSTDESAKNASAIVSTEFITIRVIKQSNEGRYLARKRGVEAAQYENILFIDSRVFVDETSLKFLNSQLQDNPDQLWNGHVNIDKKGNIFARFWDAIVCIAWRRYFHNPQTTSYGLKDFDYYPKGTGFFYVPKTRLLAAMKYFETQTNDLRHSSDDTLLIRYMIKYQDIHLSPEFSCLYHGRSNFRSFMKHAYHRGQFFIDGFLRPGTRYFYPLIAVLALSIILILSCLIWPLILLPLVFILLIVFVVALFIGALVFGVIVDDAFSLAILGVPFAMVYLLGMWRGVARKFVSRSE